VQLPCPTGNVKTDLLTQAAYLVFAELVVPAATVALVYGRTAIVAAGRRAGLHARRTAGGVAEKMAHELEQKRGPNPPPAEDRCSDITAMVDHWVNLGKDDAGIASGVRSLQRLDEPLNCRRLLDEQFNAQSIAGEYAQEKKPVFQNALDFHATVIALLQGPDVLTADREKMLAAMALHLPAHGSRIPAELSAIIDSLRAMNVSIAPGVRLLAGNDPDKISALKQQPGVHALTRTEYPLHVADQVEAGPRPSHNKAARRFIQANDRTDGSDCAVTSPQPPANPEVAGDDLSLVAPSSNHSLELEI
jgi:hypothetical protein